jgi:anti-sigma factor RsiW
MSAHPSAEQLSAFLDQELPDGVRLSIEEHLGACDACAGHLAELASVDEAARSLPFQEPVGYFDDFASRVRGRLTVRPRRTLPVWSWAAAAAVLLAVVTPLALRERSAPAPAAIMQKEAPARAADAAPPAMAPGPQAPPAGAGAGASEGADRGFMDARGRRASEAERQGRLERRDRPADALEFQSRLSRDKAEAAAEPPRPAATAPPARLEEQTAEKLKSLGYAAPPLASGQRPHGPHPQQYTPPPAAPAPAEESLASSAPVVDETLDGVRDTDMAQEKDDRFPRAKRSAPRPQAAPADGTAGGAAAETKLGATSSLQKSVPAPTGDDARRRREAFRRMAREHPDGASADASRVGTIEEGVRAYRLDGRPEDRAIAERDGRAYLARPDALQAPRVRALLRELSEPRS